MPRLISCLALVAFVPPLLGAQELVFTSRVYQRHGLSYPQLFVVRSDGQPEALTATVRRHRDPACSGDGRKIYFTSGRWDDIWPSTQLWVYDRITRQETLLLQLPAARNEADAVSGKSPEIGIYGVSSQTPLISIYQDGTNYICKYQRGIVKLAKAFSATLSPDGTRIAYNLRFHDGSDSEFGELLVMNLEGKVVARLGAGELPTWSPDGSKLAVLMSHSIRILNASSGKQLADVATPEKSDTWNFADRLAWSPKGADILVGDNQGNSTARFDNLWLLHLADMSWHNLQVHTAQAEWSGDGRSIALVTPRETGPLDTRSVWVSHLRLLNIGDSKQTIVTDGISMDREPVWCGASALEH